MKFKILGTGSYKPAKIVKNDDFAEMVETNDEWIVKRVGISERRFSADETTSDMATKASLNALEGSGLKADDLDMIIVATITPENIAPNVACSVQRNIGAKCPAMDISSACSGFVFALETATGFLAMENYHRILVVGAERLSSIVDFSDRSTCIIFADGAGAVVVSDEEDNYLSSVLHSKGGDEALHIPNASGNSPFYTLEKNDKITINMQGQETYKFAVSSMQKDVIDVMEKANLTNEDIKWVIPHQANIRIIKEASRKIPIDKEKFCSNISHTGNTSSASVAILLDELNKEGKIQKGDNIILTAFGAGLSSGACAIKF